MTDTHCPECERLKAAVLKVIPFLIWWYDHEEPKWTDDMSRYWIWSMLHEVKELSGWREGKRPFMRGPGLGER